MSTETAGIFSRTGVKTPALLYNSIFKEESSLFYRRYYNGLPLPAALTLCIAAVFAGCGLYALSGAGLLRRLPLLTPGLIFIGSIYTLHGLILMLDILNLIEGAGFPLRQMVFSAASLVAGMVHLFGVGLRWGNLHK
jgi:hypothetical protein